MSRFRVNIDSLVLKGLDADARNALVEGLRAELARVLSDPTARGMWTRSQRTPVLRLGRMTLEPGATGGLALGRGVARAIAKGGKQQTMKRSRRP
jgi:hypothetical protein